jgi:glycosyltransferase involved in cell wall biosynthesis
MSPRLDAEEEASGLMAQEQSSNGREIVLLTKEGFDPPHHGGALRAAAFSRELGRSLGANIRAICVEDTEKQDNLPRLSAAVLLWANLRVVWAFLRIGSVSVLRWYRPRVVNELVAAQRARRPRCVIIQHSQLLAYRPAITSKTAVDLLNIESELMDNFAQSATGALRVVAKYEAWRLRRLESRMGRYADLVAVVSHHDKDELTRILNDPKPFIVVAPNGLSEDGFNLEVTRADEVVFVGHLGWRPNIDAAEWLCKEVWPAVLTARPDARLNLVGKTPHTRVRRLVGPSVSLHADVPSVMPFVARARVATAPLLAAGGTRFKILEALSCGTPVVATALGALGLEDIGSPALEICDRPDDFAAAIVKLLDQDFDRAEIRSRVHSYRWPAALADFVAALQDN